MRNLTFYFYMFDIKSLLCSEYELAGDVVEEHVVLASRNLDVLSALCASAVEIGRASCRERV
mgnify:CR=1 FL=1